MPTMEDACMEMNFSEIVYKIMKIDEKWSNYSNSKM